MRKFKYFIHKTIIAIIVLLCLYAALIFVSYSEEECNVTSENAKKMQTITIDDTGVIISLPYSMEYATREKQSSMLVANNYNMTKDQFINFMENQNAFLMSIDPLSNFRVELMVFELAANSINNNQLTDIELLAEFQTPQNNLLIGTLIKRYIWRNEFHAFYCELRELTSLDTYIITASTTINCKSYHFNIRYKNTNHELMTSITNDILNSFMLMDAEREELTIETCDVSVLMPENWKLYQRIFENIDNSHNVEEIIITANAENGTRRVVRITLIDICSLSYNTIPTSSERIIFDLWYADTQPRKQIEADGFSVISEIDIADRKFCIFRISEELEQAIMLTMINGYYLRIEWNIPNGDALKDEWIPVLHSFTENLVYAMKKI